MAELIYDETGRLLFTEEMRREYTILMPSMLPIHMNLMAKVLREQGFNVELLTSTSSEIVNFGLQSVHNDTCYPALLVIGQMMHALESGRYDMNKVALIMTQTGGGCRASNYIHLVRKALKKRGLSHIPVISFNLQGMEKNPGFKITAFGFIELIGIVVYGDILMNLGNQCRPYEVRPGETDALIETWTARLLAQKLSLAHLRRNLCAIADDFAKIALKCEPRVAVGVVGEIYIKYAALGNNNLEELLAGEGCEVVVPGLLDFVIFMGDHHLVDTRRYRILYKKAIASGAIKVVFSFFQKRLRQAIARHSQFRVPATFETIKQLAQPFVSDGNKMGEGWLLTGEMLELVHAGVKNIICAQPFGCLPNHIVGKGMVRAIRENHKDANIVCVDYDPGATRTNQENRIKLMLTVAKEALQERLALAEAEGESL